MTWSLLSIKSPSLIAPFKQWIKPTTKLKFKQHQDLFLGSENVRNSDTGFVGKCFSNRSSSGMQDRRWCLMFSMFLIFHKSFFFCRLRRCCDFVVWNVYFTHRLWYTPNRACDVYLAKNGCSTFWTTQSWWPACICLHTNDTMTHTCIFRNISVLYTKYCKHVHWLCML